MSATSMSGATSTFELADRHQHHFGLQRVETALEGRGLAVDAAVCDQWGRMSASRPVTVVDGLLAATAVVHGLTLVTRNDQDIAGLGARVLNPFRGEGEASTL